MSRQRALLVYVSIVFAVAAAAGAQPANADALQSDDFHATELDTALWDVVDPAGDATFLMTGTNLWIHVPGRTTHTLWNTCTCAPQLVQPISDTDFEMEAHFESAPSQQYQLQGLVVRQDDDTYLRFDVHYGASGPAIFAAYVNGVNPPSTKISTSLASIPPYLRVKRQGDTWTFSYSDSGATWTVAGSFTRTLAVVDAGVFAGNEATFEYNTPAFVANVDYVFNTASPISPEDGGMPTAATPPLVEVWYGDNQDAGHLGTPQQWLNIVGSVWGPDGISALSYTLNGGASSGLSAGPDGGRLVGFGDYNIEIAYDDLVSGPNEIVISAEDTLGQVRDTTVTVDYTDGTVWALPDTITWSTGSRVTDVAPVIDGEWRLVNNEVRIHAGVAGFQRTLVVGDRTWASDYEVTLPFTVNEGDVAGSSQVGLLFGWQGHTGASQPRDGGSYQTVAWIHSMTTSPTLRLVRNGGSVAVETPVTAVVGQRYFLKMQSQSLGNAQSHVMVKFWQDGVPEPGTWDLEEYFTTRDGSILLIADDADVTFGDVVITPVPTLGRLLTTSTVGGGSISRSPNYTLYTDSAVVQLTAVPDSGWAFLGWSEGLSGRTNPASVTMVSDTSVAATFVPAIRSDDFHYADLDTSLWRFVSPFGDATVHATGTNLLVDLGGGVSHDLWSTCDCGVRLLQPSSDTDFEIEVKFDSRGYLSNQGQGIIVQEDDDTYLRFDAVYSSTGYTVFSGYVDGDTAETKISGTPSAHPTYLRVKRTNDSWTMRYSSNGSSWHTAGSFSQSIIVSEVGITVTNDNLDPYDSPGFISNIDYFFNNAFRIVPEDGGEATVPTPPVVTVWYGDDHVFGPLGIPQRWANVHGRVADPDHIASLSYSLNGGPSQALNIGPNGKRLVGLGDFVVEIDVDSLISGENTIWITAVDSIGEETDHLVTVDYSNGITWEMPYTAAFSTAAAIADVAQVVAGQWDLVPGGIRNAFASTGFDRCVVVGDRRWPTDYEATVPVTVHAGNIGGTAAVGFVIGWQGHTGTEQPREGTPFQTAAWIRDIPANPRIELRDDEIVHSQSAVTFVTDTLYHLKVRSESVGGGQVQVDLKLWADGDPEPVGWNLSDTFATRDGSVLLVAHYADVTYGDLVITPLPSFPQHALDVQIVGNGSVSLQPSYAAYSDSSQVVVTAVPDSGWVFQGWSGGLTGTANPDTLVMIADTSITATFAPEQFVIDITVVGNGTVEKDPEQALYDSGQLVALTAVPDSGWVFLGWSGALTGLEMADTVMVTGNLSITATFAEALYTLTTSTDGNGAVVRLPDRVKYAMGETVIVQAVADEGWTFWDWSGALTGSENPDTLTLTSDTSLTAAFRVEEFAIDITVVGDGSVTCNPGKPLYAAGEQVIVTATGGPGMGFTGWSGDLTGTDNPDTVVVDSTLSLTATFEPLVSAAGDVPALTTLRVLYNTPNPFTHGTTFNYGLPAQSDVQIDVFDAAGRRIYTERIAAVDAGWHTVRFEGVQSNGQPLPSGVYFYRVEASHSAVTRKMVIIR